MKGGLRLHNIMTKSQNRRFLRICKECDFIKFNSFLKSHNISQPAFSKFLQDDLFEYMISEQKLNIVSEELYNACCFIKDLYEEIDEKIA